MILRVCVCVGVEVLSNLPLQMCLHFNAYYSIIGYYHLLLDWKLRLAVRNHSFNNN